MYTHSCIKCKVQYEDTEPDEFYCPTCNTERLRIAAEIDAKIKAKPTKPTMSALQQYDAQEKFRGFIRVKL